MLGGSISSPEIVCDTSYARGRRLHTGKPALDRHNFMSSSLVDMYKEPEIGGSADQLDSEDDDMDVRKIFKDIESWGSSHMSWKERKALENRNVVALGGKPQKKNRIPITISKGIKKKQRKREEKMIREGMFIGQLGKQDKAENRKPGNRALRATQGHFRNGVLNVKHLMHPTVSKEGDSEQRSSKVKWKVKGKGKKLKGKKKH